MKKKSTVANKKQANMTVTTQEEQPPSATLSEASAALLLSRYGKSSFGEEAMAFSKMLDLMKTEGEKVNKGNMSEVEDMLIMQANSLQMMFTRLSSNALNLSHAPHFDMYMKFAFRAQNQCRMTLETLSNIKNPPVVYARQANIAQGHQQVNNGVLTEPSRTCVEKTINSNELLEAHDGTRLDTRTQSAPSQADTQMETVEAGWRKNTGRKRAQQDERS